MTIDRIFYGFMILVGIAAGWLLVAAPRSQDFVIKPYFWIILAILAFDLGALARGRNAPGTMLSMNARLIGFVLGVALMVLVPWLAGAPAKFF